MYLELLAGHLNCFIEYRSETIQQDCAPVYSAKLIHDWLDWVGVDYIKNWPRNCPDLTPIENL